MFTLLVGLESAGAAAAMTDFKEENVQGA